jgi:hypothetical protein
MKLGLAKTRSAKESRDLLAPQMQPPLCLGVSNELEARACR